MCSHSQPMISVIMGVYNCQDTLAEAIDSVLSQTYQDFELIICDDGSSDNSVSIVKEYVARHPDKIVFLQNEKNLGLNHTLNHCLEHARGKYVARMDGDDRSLPDRFQVELDFLEANPMFAIVSASMELFDDHGPWGYNKCKATPQPSDLVKAVPFNHACCMVRKSVYDEVGGYSISKRLLRVEDAHLWYKIYKAGYRGKNLDSVLYSCREDRDAYSRRKFRYRLNAFYVKRLKIRDFQLPFYYYIYALKPLLVGMLPSPIYKLLHRKKLSKQENA